MPCRRAADEPKVPILLATSPFAAGCDRPRRGCRGQDDRAMSDAAAPSTSSDTECRRAKAPTRSVGFPARADMYPSAKTCNCLPCSCATYNTASAVPMPAVASAPALQCVMTREPSGTSSAPCSQRSRDTSSSRSSSGESPSLRFAVHRGGRVHLGGGKKFTQKHAIERPGRDSRPWAGSPQCARRRRDTAAERGRRATAPGAFGHGDDEGSHRAGNAGSPARRAPTTSRSRSQTSSTVLTPRHTSRAGSSR